MVLRYVCRALAGIRPRMEARLEKVYERRCERVAKSLLSSR